MHSPFIKGCRDTIFNTKRMFFFCFVQNSSHNVLVPDFLRAVDRVPGRAVSWLDFTASC